jgi:hypothetical protein
MANRRVKRRNNLERDARSAPIVEKSGYRGGITWSAMLSAWQSIVAMHSLWRDAILLIALAPFAYYIFATIAALRFMNRKSENTFGPTSSKSLTPPVSLLKPVHGVDFGSIENFESFCHQNYPDYEILFAVNDDSDPAAK